MAEWFTARVVGGRVVRGRCWSPRRMPPGETAAWLLTRAFRGPARNDRAPCCRRASSPRRVVRPSGWRPSLFAAPDAARGDRGVAAGAGLPWLAATASCCRRRSSSRRSRWGPSGGGLSRWWSSGSRPVVAVRRGGCRPGRPRRGCWHGAPVAGSDRAPRCRRSSSPRRSRWGPSGWRPESLAVEWFAAGRRCSPRRMPPKETAAWLLAPGSRGRQRPRAALPRSSSPRPSRRPLIGSRPA